MGEGGHAPGRTQGRGTGSPTRRGAAGARRPTGSAGGRGPSDRRGGAAGPGGCRGRPSNLRGGCRRSGKYNKRKEAGSQHGGRRGARLPDPRPPRRRRGRGLGGARRQGAPSGVPPAPPRARHPPSKSEMIPSSCALTAGSDMVAGAEGGGEEAPRRPGPCARAPAEQSWPPAPLGPRAPLNEWGRRAGAGPRLPAPPPRPAPAARADQVPAPGPASAARTGCSARPSRPGSGVGVVEGWGPSGRRGDRPSPGRATRRPAPPRLAPRPGTATDAARPLPPGRPAAARCGRMWGPGGGAGRRRGGKRFLPFPGAQGSSCGRFYLRSQTKFAAAAAFPRSAPARVKRRGRGPGPPPVGREPRESRGQAGGPALRLLPTRPPGGDRKGASLPGAWGREGVPRPEQPGSRATPGRRPKGLLGGPA